MTTFRSLPARQIAGLDHDVAEDLGDRRRSNHPLLAAALEAFYDASDTLHILRRSLGSDPVTCALSRAARLSAAVIQTYETSLEGEVSFTDNPTLARRRAESERCRGRVAQRRPRRWRPDSSGNHPVLSLVALALNDLRQALEALHEGHGCSDQECYVCELAEEASFLCELLIAALGVKCGAGAGRRQRGTSPGCGQVLRLLRL